MNRQRNAYEIIEVLKSPQLKLPVCFGLSELQGDSVFMERISYGLDVGKPLKIT